MGGPEVGVGESTTLGAERQAGQGHTMQHRAPWTGLDAGAAHTPLESGGRRRPKPALSRLGDCSTLQSRGPGAQAQT